MGTDSNWLKSLFENPMPQKQHPLDRQVILSAADGPEGIEIYTSEEEGIVDWSPASPALYLVASVNGASIKLGPFGRGVRDQLLGRLLHIGVDPGKGESETAYLLVEHGRTCGKIYHEPALDYNHPSDYDGAYDGVDKKRRCGRCHQAICLVGADVL
jgi:hypothetical protein